MSNDFEYQNSQFSRPTTEQIVNRADVKRNRGMMGKDSLSVLRQAKPGRKFVSGNGIRILRRDNREKTRSDVINEFSDSLVKNEPLITGKSDKEEKKRRTSEDFEELETMRNGAINRSLEKGLLRRRKKTRENDALGDSEKVRNPFGLSPRKLIPRKYTYQTEKQISSYGGFHAPSQSNRSTSKKTPSKRQLDSFSTFDMHHSKDWSDENSKDETFAVNLARPKSAGQAMYMRINGLSSDSDDSSLEGEIEVIDLDNGLQFDDDDSAVPESAFKRSAQTTSDAFVLLSDDKGRERYGGYHGNDENRRHVEAARISSRATTTSDPVEKADENDVIDIAVKRSRKLMTSEARRRIKSEADIVRPADGYRLFKEGKSSSVKVKRGPETKSSFQLLEHQENKPKISHHKPQSVTDLGNNLKPKLGKEKLYADAFEKVLSKYSRFTIARDGTTQPAPLHVPDKRSGSRAARAQLPRKLKPILNREKLSPISQNKTGERDLEISTH